MNGTGDYDKCDGLALAELVRRKEVKPIELVEEAIRRVEKLNPKLNAIVHTMFDQAREAAEKELPNGPFRGVPFLLKDLLAAHAGVPMRAGSRLLRDFVPERDSELVARYKAAGLIILGTANTPEFGLAAVTEPELYGPCNNPWDLRRNSGGSSGGSAAAVAPRIVPLAHGNDAGGSIRIPASCCAVFGLKPTRGRNPAGPDFGEALFGLACDHVLTRSVRDSAAMLDATAGPDVGAPYFAERPRGPFLREIGADVGRLRIAYTSRPFLGDRVHPECLAGLESTAKLCEDLGHEIVEATPQISGEALAVALAVAACTEMRAMVEEVEVLLGRKATSRDFESITWMALRLGRRVKGVELCKAIHQLQAVGRRVGAFFEQFDVLLTPTLAMPPVLTGTLRPKAAEEFLIRLLGKIDAGGLLKSSGAIEASVKQGFRFTPYTPLANGTGQPAMSIPLYWNVEGLPIGMQFMGKYGDEATLFRLAAQLEEARPWADRVPPVCMP